MILTTHAVVGAGLAVLAKANPVAAFGMGFLSHFLLDAIPHWEYPIQSKGPSTNPLQADMVLGKAFVLDMIFIGSDFALGITLGLLMLSGENVSLATIVVSPVFWGSLGAVAPDFLQFAYFKIKREPLTSLQKFHIFIHSDYRFPHKSFVGPLIQVAIIVFVLAFTIFR